MTKGRKAMGIKFYAAGIILFIFGASAMDSESMILPAVMVVCGIGLAAIGYFLDERG